MIVASGRYTDWRSSGRSSHCSSTLPCLSSRARISHISNQLGSGICLDHLENSLDFSVSYFSVYWLYFLSPRVSLIRTKNQAEAFPRKIERKIFQSNIETTETSHDVMKKWIKSKRPKTIDHTAPSKAQAQIEVLKISIFYSDKDVATPRKHN